MGKHIIIKIYILRTTEHTHTHTEIANGWIIPVLNASITLHFKWISNGMDVFQKLVYRIHHKHTQIQAKIERQRKTGDP